MLRTFYFMALIIGMAGFVIPNHPSIIINDCVFTNPDTSVSGIKIRDVTSTHLILGKKTRLEGDSTHCFYSKGRDQVLSMTVHPGDYYSQVSIFKVGYTLKSKPTYRKTNIDSFKTEKGIRLGMLKEEVVRKLGQCYSSSTRKGVEVIVYRIENHRDSKTKLLERNNMPIYYANYTFKRDKLIMFEFGFEYP